MSSFKDYMTEDIDVFFNVDEFAEPHRINGRGMDIVMDEDRLKQRSQTEFEGIGSAEVLFFVKVSDLEEKPEVGSPLKFDKKQMYVLDVKEDSGTYEIILTQNRGGWNG